jgi:hypothetical protein
LVENPSTRSFIVPYNPCPPTPRPHNQVGKGSLITTATRMVALHTDHPDNQTIESGFRALNIPVST